MSPMGGHASGLAIFEDEPVLVWPSTAFRFWIPLAIPLGLPPNFSIVTTVPMSNAELSELDVDVPNARWLVGSTCCRQVQQAASPIRFRNAEAAFVAQRLGAPGQVALNGSIADEMVPVTVIEAVTYGWHADDVSDAFDHALSLVQKLQRSVGVTTSTPFALASRECLPPLIPMSSHDAHAPFEEFLENAGAFAPNANVPETLLGPKISDEQLDLIAYVGGVEQSTLGPRIALDLILSAQYQLNHLGNYRSAVLDAATASEALLNHLVAGLLWEEGLSPRQAGEVLKKSQFLPRIRSVTKPRLGGNWDSDTSGPIRTWESDCYHLRHRVVHRGDTPTRAEASDAIEAVTNLVSFVADRLRYKSKMFPRVAWKWVGPERLNPGGRRVAQVLSEAEANWDSMFARWYLQVSAVAWPEIFEPREDRLQLFAVLVGGHATPMGWWVVVDPTTSMARECSPAPITEPQIERLREIASTLEADELYTIELMGRPNRLLGSWRPSVELLTESFPLHPTCNFPVSRPPLQRLDARVRTSGRSHPTVLGETEPDRFGSTK